MVLESGAGYYRMKIGLWRVKLVVRRMEMIRVGG